MKKLLLIVGLVALVLAVSAGWQIVSCELANRQLQEDLRDLSVQGAARIGLAAPSSDDDLRNAVIAKAKQYDILLQPNQVTVTRAPDGQSPALYVTADYIVPLHVLGLSFALHFTPSSSAKAA
jgi:hypothetical protein